jgi:hypothetical protein
MKYGTFRYNTALYGEAAALPYSVEPMEVLALDYDKVEITWNNATGTFSAARLLRSTDGYSETAEDGVILWENTNSTLLRTSFIDGIDNFDLDDNTNEITTGNKVPLPLGGYLFYTLWLKDAEGIWQVAGGAYTLLPKQHGSFLVDGTTFQTTHQKFMDYLPRMYTSITKSPLDEIDETSDLYNFFEPISFTADQFLTYLDLLLPNVSGKNINPNFLEIAALQYGLTPELALPQKYQKKAIRDARYIYSHKGTPLALSLLVENLTGYAPEVTTNQNLMVSLQDSTFYKTLGFWLPYGNCTLTLETTTITPSVSTSVDDAYCGKVVVTTAGAHIANGVSSPRTRGIQVSAGTEYKFSYYAKAGSGTPTTTPSITWYTHNGDAISTSTAGSATTLSTSWTSSPVSYTATAPANSVYATVKIAFGTVQTYYIDLVQFAKSSVTDYHDARNVEVFLNPTKTNLLTNPSFETNTTGWVTNNATVTRPTTTLNKVISGSKMIQLVTNSTATTSTSPTLGYTTSAGTDVGKFYTFSFYGGLTSGSQTVSLKLKATDGTTTVDSVVSVGLTNEWLRHSVSLYVPDTLDPTTTTLSVALYGTTGSKTIVADACQLEASFIATDYFDGSFPSSFGAVWEGTANASRSHYYANKPLKVSRLFENMQTVIPANTPYIVTSYSGIESKGIM